MGGGSAGEGTAISLLKTGFKNLLAPGVSAADVSAIRKSTETIAKQTAKALEQNEVQSSQVAFENAYKEKTKVLYKVAGTLLGIAGTTVTVDSVVKSSIDQKTLAQKRSDDFMKQHYDLMKDWEKDAEKTKELINETAKEVRKQTKKYTRKGILNAKELLGFPAVKDSDQGKPVGDNPNVQEETNICTVSRIRGLSRALDGAKKNDSDVANVTSRLALDGRRDSVSRDGGDSVAEISEEKYSLASTVGKKLVQVKQYFIFSNTRRKAEADLEEIGSKHLDNVDKLKRTLLKMACEQKIADADVSSMTYNWLEIFYASPPKSVITVRGEGILFDRLVDRALKDPSFKAVYDAALLEKLDTPEKCGFVVGDDLRAVTNKFYAHLEPVFDAYHADKIDAKFVNAKALGQNAIHDSDFINFDSPELLLDVINDPTNN